LASIDFEALAEATEEAGFIATGSRPVCAFARKVAPPMAIAIVANKKRGCAKARRERENPADAESIDDTRN
jgi:hypothetical protein